MDHRCDGEQGGPAQVRSLSPIGLTLTTQELLVTHGCNCGRLTGVSYYEREWIVWCGGCRPFQFGCWGDASVPLLKPDRVVSEMP